MSTEGQYFNYPLDAHATSVDVWNLTYQRQFASNWVRLGELCGQQEHSHLDGRGRRSGHLHSRATVVPVNTGSRRQSLLDDFKHRPKAAALPAKSHRRERITRTSYQADDGANAEYNAFLAKVEHRFTENYTILANYTYSHCISEADFGGDLGGSQH